jgi:hypothetical protein
VAKPPRTITLNDSALLCYALLDESVGYTVGHGLFFALMAMKLAECRVSRGPAASGASTEPQWPS